MKIGIVFDADHHGGGGFYQSLRTLDIILKIKNNINSKLLLPTIIQKNRYLI